MTAADAVPLWVEAADRVNEVLTAAGPAILEHRDKDFPHEAVGIICADADIYPLINQARSPHRFEVSSILVGEAVEELRKWGKQPVGVYHSHPESASSPSMRDQLMMQETPNSLHVIIGLDGISAWMWDDGLRSVTKIDLPERVPHGEPG